jgi:uncharacterized protein DUF1876
MTKKNIRPKTYPTYPAYQPVPQPPQAAYPAYQQAAYPPPAPQDMHSVSISVLSSHGATVAKVTYASVYNTGVPVSAAGNAKREPGDDYDQETGRLLATSRALEILAGKLRRQANGRVRNAETVKQHRRRARDLQALAGVTTAVERRREQKREAQARYIAKKKEQGEEVS